MEQFALMEQKQKNKQLNKTLSYEDEGNSLQINAQQNNISTLLRQSTSFDKITNYVNFFATIQNENKNSIDLQKFHLIHLQNNQNQLVEKKGQHPGQGEHKEENFLNQNGIKFLAQYQSFHHQKLQQKILKSGRFKKVDSFTSQLLIYDIHPSKHYEIVKIGVQLLTYRTQILILNSLSKSPLPQMAVISGSGGFGSIYFIRTMQDQLAIKSIEISETIKLSCESKDQLSSLLMKAIKELFWLLLFSELQIGPKVKTICGFDIILYEDSIQFATEVCEFLTASDQNETKKYETEVSKALFDMHMLQVIHRDVKPSNIMFSPTFRKHVLIDFGCSQVINQTLGEMTFTKFIGTALYCSEQMLSLLQKKVGFVDLYYNDLFGLKKTFSDKIQNLSIQTKLQQKYKISHHHQLSMKYYLYHNDFEEFFNLWQKIYNNNFDDSEEIQLNIIKFLPQLKIISIIKQFYWTQISQSVREKDQFKQIHDMMINQHQLFAQISTSKIKLKEFSSLEEIYKNITIKNSFFSQKEIQLDQILINLKSVEKFLQSLEEKLKGTQKLTLIQNQEQLTNVFLVIALFSSLASNYYTSILQKKTHACEIGLELFKSKYGKEKDNKVIFQSSNQSFRQLVKFHQHFLLHMWSRVPNRYKSISIINSLITLYLLGYPTNVPAVTFYPIHMALVSAKQSLISQSFEIKMLTIRIFWQCKLVTLVFSQMFYNISNLKFTNLQQSEYNSQSFQQFQKILFHHQGEEQMGIVFKVNHQIYKQLVLNYLNFSQLTYEKITELLNSPEVLKFQTKNSDVRKWKSLMKLLLYSFGYIYKIQKAGQNLPKFHHQIIFQHQYKQNILPYSICLYFETLSKQKTINELYTLIDEIINTPQISLRISPHHRLKVSLRKKDDKIIEEITKMIGKQSKQQNVKEFLISQHPILYNLVVEISLFVQQYLGNLPMLITQAVFFLSKCFQCLKELIHIGYLHYDAFKDIMVTKQFKAQEITIQMIEAIYNKGKLIRNYFYQLLKVFLIFQKIQTYINEQKDQCCLPLQQKLKHFCVIKNRFSFWSQSDAHYLAFLKLISENNNILSYSQYWLRFIQKFPKIQQNFSYQIFHMYQAQRQTVPEIYKTQQIIQDLFDPFQPQIFQQDYGGQKIIPSFQIAFDYFQIKILKTNYGLQEAQKLIKLFKICVKKESFHVVFHKKGLLRFMFNAYIYTNKSHQQILQLFVLFTKSLENSPQKSRTQLLHKNISSFFWCNCKRCLPRQPQKWNTLQFVEYLFNTISKINFLFNPYMALVYFSAIMNQQVRHQIKQKFLKFIVQSMFYVSKDVQSIIKAKIHFLFYLAFVFPYRKQYVQTKGLKGTKEIRNFPKTEKNLSIHRKFLYLYLKIKKHEEIQQLSINQIVEAILQRQKYFQNTIFPKIIRQNYKKKLRRYFEIKQNYKHSYEMQQLRQLKPNKLICQ